MKIRPLKVDFAPASWRVWLSDFSVIYWLLLLVALIFGTLLFMVIEPLINQQQELRASIEKATDSNRRMAAKKTSAALVQKTLKSDPAIQEMVARLNHPWLLLLDTLEQVLPSSVKLLSADIDGKTQTLKVTAESKNLASMFESIELLQSDPHISYVELVEEKTNNQDTNKPIRFQIVVRVVH